MIVCSRTTLIRFKMETAYQVFVSKTLQKTTQTIIVYEPFLVKTNQYFQLSSSVKHRGGRMIIWVSVWQLLCEENVIMKQCLKTIFSPLTKPVQGDSKICLSARFHFLTNKKKTKKPEC